jgi:hypothetical protein
LASPLRPPRVSPCIGLGLIGCGGAVGGAGAGLVAMALILPPFRQSDDPGGDLENQHDEADPEHQEQPPKLPSVGVRRGGSVQRKISLDEREFDGFWLMYSAMISDALALKDQSLLGHSTVSTHPPTTMKAATATHTQMQSSAPTIAREPKNEVVIAAAAMSTPARERNSFTARSWASSARPASSNARS